MMASGVAAVLVILSVSVGVSGVSVDARSFLLRRFDQDVEDATKQNVIGGTLKTCSSAGEALTGFTRTGFCVEEDDDAGSHHICIKMKSDFCTVTKQSDWCSQPSECMGKEGTCPIKNWCVCQWAFRTYIKMAGGCSAIDEIECESTNMEALKAYRAAAATDADTKVALDCLESRCGIVN